MKLASPWNTLAGREWIDRRAPLTLSTPSRRREAWCALLAEHVPATTRTELAAEAGVDRSTLRRWLAVAADLPELALLLAPAPDGGNSSRVPARGTSLLFRSGEPRTSRPPRPRAAVAPWSGYAGRRLLREAAPGPVEADQRSAWLALVREALEEAASLDELAVLLGISRRTAARWSAWLRREGVTRATRRRRGA